MFWTTRQITDVQPRFGSAGGTRLTITGSGFGLETDTEGIKIQGKVSGATFEDLCTEVEIVENGVFTCLTVPRSSNFKVIRIKDTRNVYGIGKQAGVSFGFDQRIGRNLTPTVDSISIEGTPANMVRFKGSGFLTLVEEGSVATAHFRGHIATEVSCSDTDALLEFENGVPLVFVDDD